MQCRHHQRLTVEREAQLKGIGAKTERRLETIAKVQFIILARQDCTEKVVPPSQGEIDWRAAGNGLGWLPANPLQRHFGLQFTVLGAIDSQRPELALRLELLPAIKAFQRHAGNKRQQRQQAIELQFIQFTVKHPGGFHGMELQLGPRLVIGCQFELTAVQAPAVGYGLPGNHTAIYGKFLRLISE